MSPMSLDISLYELHPEDIGDIQTSRCKNGFLETWGHMDISLYDRLPAGK